MDVRESVPLSKLSLMENIAVKLGRLNENKTFRRLQCIYGTRVVTTLISQITGNRLYLDNIEWLRNLNPTKGVIMVGNHRSFFDLWLACGGFGERKFKWPTQYTFPVRSNFFYDNPVGVFINFLTSGGVMYPPIMRDRNKSDWNVDAVNRIVDFVSHKGAVLGMHPEGTRGKGPDPYELGSGKPGIGEIMLRSNAIVVPFFINGISNSIVDCIKQNRKKDRRLNPVVIVYGKQFDYQEYVGQEPTKKLYKSLSENLLNEVRALMPREKQIRLACAAGEVSDQDLGWY